MLQAVCGLSFLNQYHNRIFACKLNIFVLINENSSILPKIFQKVRYIKKNIKRSSNWRFLVSLFFLFLFHPFCEIAFIKASTWRIPSEPIHFLAFKGIESLKMNTAIMKSWLPRILWMFQFISVYCIFMHPAEVSQHHCQSDKGLGLQIFIFKLIIQDSNGS